MRNLLDNKGVNRIFLVIPCAGSGSRAGGNKAKQYTRSTHSINTIYQCTLSTYPINSTHPQTLLPPSHPITLLSHHATRILLRPRIIISDPNHLRKCCILLPPGTYIAPTHSIHTPYQHNSPYQYTLSTHPINTPSLTHPITPYPHTLSTQPIHTVYQLTLSIHPINTPSQHTLSTHPLSHTLSKHTLSYPFSHPITPGLCPAPTHPHRLLFPQSHHHHPP